MITDAVVALVSVVFFLATTSVPSDARILKRSTSEVDEVATQPPEGLSAWCNNKAYNDYGLVNQDCCKDTNVCDWYVKPQESKGNLTNDSSFTRRTCKCDEEFFDCNTDNSPLFVRSMIHNFARGDLCAENNTIDNQLEWVNSSTWLDGYEGVRPDLDDPEVIKTIIFTRTDSE